MTRDRMLKFISQAQAMPDKRPAQKRVRDFAEIYADFAAQKAAEQAARCSQCGVPFCQIHCPLQNNIPDWLKLTAEGRLREAYALSAATNTMPEICGRICPQDRLCEGNCVIEKGFSAVTIGAVEKYLTETAWTEGWVAPLRPTQMREQSVGIIGAGPAGLAAAEECRKQGYKVAVYDRHDRAGGLLVYGIPNFKLDKAVVARRVARLVEGGIAFHLNTEVGRDLSLADVRARHDAVLIATGVYQARALKAPGVGLPQIEAALPYLIAANRKGLGDEVPAFDDGRLDAAGKHVVVIGGGDTAMDCVRTAVRQGARSVKCLYRRDRANMPGSAREVVHAEEEGVEFVWLTAPHAFIGKSRVTAVQAHAMRLGTPDASGRARPEVVPGGRASHKADLVILALGFDPEDLPARLAAPDLGVTRWATLKVAPQTLATNLDGVFAAGDIVRGASLVVWAIRDGRDAAAAIHRYLLAKAGTAQAVAAQ
ncbi:MAG: NAD(P)-dependent oxidoreductase [Pseudomonadota bacterium]